MSNHLLDQLLQLPTGARFYRADLHNHTPADRAFHCGDHNVSTEEQKRSFARTYVRFARESRGLDIIGVTDHNDVSWHPYIQEAAREVGLIVFPGIELGAMAGKRQVHFLALFDPQTPSDRLDHFLSTLGLMPEGRFHTDGTPKAVQKDTCQLTASIVRPSDTLRGLPIAAHVSGRNGLLCEMEGEARVRAYQDSNLLAVEIPRKRVDLSKFERELIEGKHNLSGNKAVACLNHSDGRGLDQVLSGRQGIGASSTLIKLSHLSIEGLRQAFLDFDSRIRLEGEYREERYPRVLGLAVEGGFLAGQPDEAGTATQFLLRFNPNLNTIIGGRGAGKSALLEAIRYAFDLPARTDSTRRQANEIIQATLLAFGARVTLFYELADGTQYEIRRVKGHPPEVYDVASGKKKDVTPADLLPGGTPLEIYSQKEIYEISNDVSFQLNLLDTYVAEELRDTHRLEDDLLRSLEANATDILRLEDDIAQASQRLQELAGVRLEVERMERHAAAARFDQKKSYEREKTLIDRLDAAVSERLQAVQQFGAVQDALRPLLPADPGTEGLPHAALLARQAIIAAEIDLAFASALTQLQHTIAELWEAGSAERFVWQADYDQMQAEYEKLLQKLGQDFSAERYFSLRARLLTLEGIEGEIARRRERLQEMKRERRVLLLALRRLRYQREFKIRKTKAARLTEELQDTVRVTVVREGNRDAYARKLADLFAGRRIEKSVIEKVARVRRKGNVGYYGHPMHLACAIRCEQSHPSDEESILASFYGISKAYRDRLAQIDEHILYELETYRIPDLPDICLKVGEQYRSLKPPPGQPGLSTGQKCTAILSIILVEREAPLIIDQPEDDLDNEFIFRQIVRTLRREKERRQFIVATHNANIPVTGDAELIVVMRADEQHGWVAQCGSIDDPALREPVENILEGGREAFHLRQIKYELPE